MTGAALSDRSARGRAWEDFDVCGELPPAGVTLLEASAGTGKTFTIASLAVRYIAAGLPIEQLLVVTFTRAATSELRDRVRHRLVEAARGLSVALAGGSHDAAHSDATIELLSRGSQEELSARASLLERALRRFDSATIATTHGFCEQMLRGLGVTGEPLYQVRFLEDLRDLADETAADLYAARATRWAVTPFKLGEARMIVRRAVGEPDVGILPTADGGASDPDAERVALALGARRAFTAREEARSLIGYDDLQLKLRDALLDARGGAASERLRTRYRVVLVDEFQDTDPVQWMVLQEAFVAAGVTLVLIGDPKQAIYSFRGADVLTYLDAAGRAGVRAGLSVNWRSDADLIAALDVLFDGAQLGHPEIAYRPVRASAEHAGSRLGDAEPPAPLRLRLVSRIDPRRGRPRALNKDKTIPADDLRKEIVSDLVADVVRLLGSPTRLPEGGRGPWRRVEPGDVAVLVHRNADADLVRAALGEAGLPAVMLGTDSVFDAPAATTWLDLLEALDRPGDRSRSARVALGDFVGWDARQVHDATPEDWASLSIRLHQYETELRERGVASLYTALLRSGEVPARLLGRTDGERTMTDLAHVAQLMHAAALTEQLGERSLTDWLRRRVATDGAEEDAAEGLARRLELDSHAVQVVTVHRSKGLEFPIVYAPFLMCPPYRARESDGPAVFHAAAEGNRRVLEVGTGGESAAHRSLSWSEQRDESLRLAYVALTRARHQVVIWYAPWKGGNEAPLTRLLFGRAPDGAVADAPPLPSDEDAALVLARLVERAGGTIAVETVGLPLGVVPAPAAEEATAERLEPGDLSRASFGRRVDWSWRRTSYSGLVAAGHADPTGADPDEGDDLDDEPPRPAPVELADAGARTAVPLSDVPGGVEIGTFVHRLLQELDFAAADLEVAVRAQMSATPGIDRLAAEVRPRLAAGLAAALETPLGPLLGELALSSLPRADRLDELEFELPLAGGERPRGELRLADLADVLEAYLPPGDPLERYPERLREPAISREFRGYLTGSIDLVARHRGRFFVADYKTNRLVADGEELTPWHYRPAALAEAMMAAHYPLQALLYDVALHRYLRWRLPGYQPAVHLGGIAYLFLRGMAGADTPRFDGQPSGVFAWLPPQGLVEELNAVPLDAGRPSVAPLDAGEPAIAGR